MSEHKHIASDGEAPPPEFDFGPERGDDDGTQGEGSGFSVTQASCDDDIANSYLPAHSNRGSTEPEGIAQVSGASNGLASHVYPTADEHLALADGDTGTPTERGGGPPPAYAPGHGFQCHVMISEMKRDLREAESRGRGQECIQLAKEIARREAEFEEMERWLREMEREEVRGYRVAEHIPL